jgi:hypothetical protein
VIFESQKLRDAPNGKPCVRCASRPHTTVGAHYTGMRRGSYGGGMGQKVWDFCMADLCDMCHEWMDRLSRDKTRAVEHSEEFQHLILLTLVRRFDEGVIVVKGQRERKYKRPSKIVPRREARTEAEVSHVHD